MLLCVFSLWLPEVILSLGKIGLTNGKIGLIKGGRVSK